MPEDFLTPEKLGMLGMMTVAIAAFMRGWIVTASHVTDLKLQVVELKAQYESRIVELTNDREDYKNMLRDAVIVTRRTLDAHGAPRKE